ncbi:MAG: PQQ-dependent sugar dehydrogenase [Alphaproteobacteria bacterium]|nr:PQQ-dependent sugar dehydrogenase [Alphaproteobacteria bacterium]
MRTRVLAGLLIASLLVYAWVRFRVVPQNHTAAAVPPTDDRVAGLHVPPGFRIDVVTKDAPDARGMAWGPDGVLFVGSRSAGNVYAVVDADGDHHPERVVVVASGLDMPVGVDVHDGDLYASSMDRIVRFPDLAHHLDDPPAPVLVTDALPQERPHGWKFIRFGPDGRLYVPIGAPCNACETPADPRFGTIGSMNADGSDPRIEARGVRNSVGFDWDPVTGDLWFTDNGRDLLGDDTPPCELNHLVHRGDHFGFPYCHGVDIPDPDLGRAHPCRDYVPPALALRAHVAPLGMRFYTGSAFPARYRGAIFLAEHGSWNRTTPQGYQVDVVFLDDDRQVVAYEPFVTGWLQGEEAWGRPVDVLVHPDGSLYVSDDRAGWIYRVWWEGP